VLFISGGYDDAKDPYKERVEDASGRAVYIVDALTGERIWSASPAASAVGSEGYNQQFIEMKYSIPAALTVADVNSDGLDDIIVVGDTGGQLWRFDLAVGKPVDEFIRGGVIADLGVAGGDNTEARNRRFYHSPDIALTERDGEVELAITIGSGFRPSPLSTVTQDRFFMIRQAAVFGAPLIYSKITDSDLYDATDNRVADGKLADGSDADIPAEEGRLSAKKGWYIDLVVGNGEKVLSTPITFRDRVVFVTYTPSAEIVDCNAKAGTSRVYYVNLGDASPVKDWTTGSAENCEGTNCDENDRYYQLQTPSIIDEPVFICTDEGCDLFTGAEKPPVDRLTSDRVVKTYWRKDIN
jgi:type IV pilus assembly protein PilY1